MTVIDEMMMAMMVFLFLFRIFKPLWTLMFHFNFSSAIIRAATCKQEDPLQKKYKKKKILLHLDHNIRKKKKKKKKKINLNLNQNNLKKKKKKKKKKRSFTISVYWFHHYHQLDKLALGTLL